MLGRILRRKELWLISLAVVTVGSAMAWFTWRIVQLLEQGQQTSFEATYLILQAIIVPLIAAPALAAALVGVAALRAQRRAQMEARRPIIDLRLTGSKPGASQYENLVTISVTNLGPGPGIDLEVLVVATGRSHASTKVGLIGSEISGASSTVEAEITIPVQIIGQAVQLTAVYLDLFGNVWKSARAYTSFPTGEGLLGITRTLH